MQTDERSQLVTASVCRPSPTRSPEARSNDYLLLSRVDSHGEDISIPRPRLWFLLPLFGAVDAAYTITAAASFGVQGGNEITMVTWGLTRAVIVVLATSNRRVRETGWLIVGSAMISALAALAELNLIIQQRAWAESSIPAILALYCFSHVFFGLLHWFGFAAVVGVTRERNPYGLGLHSVRHRPGMWREGVAHLNISRGSIDADDDAGETSLVDRNDSDWEDRLRRKRRAIEEGFQSEDDSHDGLDTSEDEDDVPIDATMRDYDEEETEGEGEDDFAPESPRPNNDIIDIIPSPSTALGPRRRTVSQSRSLRARTSFYARGTHNGSPEEGLSPTLRPGEPSPISASSGYGTFRSLVGI